MGKNKIRVLVVDDSMMMRRMIGRALTWDHFLATVTGPEKEEFASAVPSFLKEFLEAMLQSEPYTS